MFLKKDLIVRFMGITLCFIFILGVSFASGPSPAEAQVTQKRTHHPILPKPKPLPKKSCECFTSLDYSVTVSTSEAGKTLCKCNGNQCQEVTDSIETPGGIQKIVYASTVNYNDCKFIPTPKGQSKRHSEESLQDKLDLLPMDWSSEMGNLENGYFGSADDLEFLHD